MARGQRFPDGFRAAVRHVLFHNNKNISRTARLFGISRGAVRNTLRTVVARKLGRPSKRTKEVEDEVLKILEEDDIGLTPAEVRDKLWANLLVNLSERTVRRVMEDNFITRKKIDKHAIERDSEYNKVLTEQFLAEVCLFLPSFYICSTLFQQFQSTCLFPHYANTI